MYKNWKPEDVVKSCYKLESGLRLGQEGVHACQLGPFSSPIFFTEAEAAKRKISKQDIVEKRQWIFELLNDESSTTPCKKCSMVVDKKFKDVSFDRLGHVDLAAATTCNLRCNFCVYTHFDLFDDAKYNALDILREFKPQETTWNSAVDFNGGEPTLLKDFDDYIEYFKTARTRVFLYTNGVVYKQSVYDGLLSGAIRWAVVSLDAGTKSTYEKTKLSPKYEKVLENIARYSEAGNAGNGGCAVKYIFHKDNISDDDVIGFSYAMLALRPQEVWLTFDFDPLGSLPADCEDFGGYDYSPHVEAYAKVFLCLEKHGVKAVHYAEKHLAPASKHGVILLEMVKTRIEQLRRLKSESLKLKDFRLNGNSGIPVKDGHFQIDDGKLKIFCNDGFALENIKGKKVAIAPASPQIREFVARLQDAGLSVVAIADKDKVLHGKSIDDIEVIPYESLKKLDVAMVFVATTNLVIEPQIITSLNENSSQSKIFTFSYAHSAENERQMITDKFQPPIVADQNCSIDANRDINWALEDLIKWSRHTV